MANRKVRIRSLVRAIPTLANTEYWRGKYRFFLELLQKIWHENLFPPPSVGLRMAKTVYGADKQPGASNVCLFSAFSYNNVVSEYAIRYVAELSRCDLDVIYLSASILSPEDIARLSPYCRMIVEKENVCPDFSAWKIGLLLTNNAKEYENVLLTNDSVFGPMHDLKKIIDGMNSKKLDFWGMTDSYEGEWHLQSYFLWFTRPVLDGRAWAKFWRSIRSFTNKPTVIEKYEMKLTATLMKAGYQFDAFIRSDTLKALDYDNLFNDEPTSNPILIHALFLIDKLNFPFVKRSLFSSEFFECLRMKGEKGNAYWHSLEHWKEVVIGRTSYPTELIENELKKFPKCVLHTKKNPASKL